MTHPLSTIQAEPICPIPVTENNEFEECIHSMNLPQALRHIEMSNIGTGHQASAEQIWLAYNRVLMLLMDTNQQTTAILRRQEESLKQLWSLDTLLKQRSVSSAVHWRKSAICGTEAGRAQLLLQPEVEGEERFPLYDDVNAQIIQYSVSERIALRCHEILAQSLDEKTRLVANSIQRCIQLAPQIQQQNIRDTLEPIFSQYFCEPIKQAA